MNKDSMDSKEKLAEIIEKHSNLGDADISRLTQVIIDDGWIKPKPIKDLEREIEKIVDNTLAREAVIVANGDDSRFKNWSGEKITANYQLRQVTVKGFLTLFQSYLAQYKKEMELIDAAEAAGITNRIFKDGRLDFTTKLAILCHDISEAQLEADRRI